MKYSEYKKHKKVNNITFILSVVFKIVIFISLILFAVTFQTHSNISTYTIFYGRYILPPLLILLFCWEIHKIDSEKAKVCRRFSQFEKIAKAQELAESSSSEPFYEYLCTFYAKSKVAEWVEDYVNIAIHNFDNDKCLSLYSMALFEQEIKKNWDKYKGRKVSTDGFAFASPSNFTFIAYPFFDDIPHGINSDKNIYFRIDEEKAKAYVIKYHQLVFQSSEQLVINQALDMINAKWEISDNKQIEFDTGTKAILTGTLDIDKNGNLTIINCELTRNDIFARISREQ